jgi:hypothetical protein
MASNTFVIIKYCLVRLYICGTLVSLFYKDPIHIAHNIIFLKRFALSSILSIIITYGESLSFEDENPSMTTKLIEYLIFFKLQSSVYKTDVHIMFNIVVITLCFFPYDGDI